MRDLTPSPMFQENVMLSLNVNGTTHRVDVEPEMPL